MHPPQVDVWAPLGPDWAGWQDFFNDVIADFFAEEEDDVIFIEKDTRVCTVFVLRMSHRKWKDTKQHPGTAGPGNMLGCCLISFQFLWAILSTSTVHCFTSLVQFFPSHQS